MIVKMKEKIYHRIIGEGGDIRGEEEQVIEYNKEKQRVCI